MFDTFLQFICVFNGIIVYEIISFGTRLNETDNAKIKEKFKQEINTFACFSLFLKQAIICQSE